MPSVDLGVLLTQAAVFANHLGTLAFIDLGFIAPEDFHRYEIDWHS